MSQQHFTTPPSILARQKDGVAPKKQTREEYRQQKELEELRKAGSAPAEVDEEGKDINPHIPKYMVDVPWYVTYDHTRPTLKHQRIHPEKSKNHTEDLNKWYPRGQVERVATKYRPGACENCGAVTHKKKDCIERPRRVGARFTGENFAPDEYVQSDINLSWDGKRDRWNGIDINWHQTKIHDEYTKLEDAKKLLKSKKLDDEENEMNKGLNATAATTATATDEGEKQTKVEDEDNLESIVTVAEKVIDGNAEKSKEIPPETKRQAIPTKAAAVDSDDENEDEEFKYVEEMAMPGQHVDSKQRISVRNLRIREDTAKYLLNLDSESAYYDPKSRSMRENPFDGTTKDPASVPYLGDNFVRYSGDANQFAKTQMFAWEAYEKGVNVHTQGDPTKLELLNKEFSEKKNDFVKKIQSELIERYGGEEHLNTLPKELVLEAQTENYVEYNRFGKVIKGNERLTTKSKYTEDIYENNHTSVWGSYWSKGKWGYKCCHLLIRQSYCPGFVLQEEILHPQDEEGSIDDDRQKSMVELHREKLAKQKPSKAVGKDDKALKLDKKKIQEAAKMIDERERQANELLKLDERKRSYNSLQTDSTLAEPTEEELEAYRLKKFRHDDPMSQFMLNS
ncbi:unnamed protein product [Didymodactylos carnosus]|uniref:Pre-mRNA-splicing factor SLU7 n=1 Tax=Didymodactylos carnosus TaxID=1234261 RepID=A0A813X7Q9_9BILA|nr:unnamed protein product [Didymodactylos carnosus]CAF0866542.1 unnamed protein product [Didymodactylos carnosus]CAF3513249.1 unnamed protein product [Didymodactylos carnosus]CAF3654025.1 unnamed protein product [Didymodactylos carnosus]